MCGAHFKKRRKREGESKSQLVRVLVSQQPGGGETRDKTKLFVGVLVVVCKLCLTLSYFPFVLRSILPPFVAEQPDLVPAPLFFGEEWRCCVGCVGGRREEEVEENKTKKEEKKEIEEVCAWEGKVRGKMKRRGERPMCPLFSNQPNTNKKDRSNVLLSAPQSFHRISS